MITREALQWMFGTARADDSWNIDAECDWSYFFSGDERKLGALAETLRSDGFRLVSMTQPGRLRVERRDKHTVDSLDELNQRLNGLAQRSGLAYDGMDAGPRIVELGAIVASLRVARDRKPVGSLYRVAPENDSDSGWRVFSGDEIDEYLDDAANFSMCDVATLLAVDPRVAPLLGREAPVAFELDDASGDFVEVEFPA
jgi:hypothetical protein